MLLSRGKTSKVQLSAFEKELAAELKLAIGENQVKNQEVVPLSWTLKAVTLEPSLTVAPVGAAVVAEHFVGINQTENAPLAQLSKLSEVVKTLKGTDPNLQTAYLLLDKQNVGSVEREIGKRSRFKRWR